MKDAVKVSIVWDKYSHILWTKSMKNKHFKLIKNLLILACFHQLLKTVKAGTTSVKLQNILILPISCCISYINTSFEETDVIFNPEFHAVSQKTQS